MKITDLEVDGFGVWKGLRLDNLAEELNVFHGPNEAGKTTLLEFVRSVFYGFSEERRRHYLPPLRGGRAGGSIQVSGPNGRFRVSRHDDDPDASATEGNLRLTGADGTLHGGQYLRVLLTNIDEPIFDNVFAIGLQELQHLGSLGDTEAAQLLYDLTTGLDRVSLVEVMRELEASRIRLLAPDERPSQIGQWLAEREKLRGEIEELRSQGRRYWHLAQERERSRHELARLEEEKGRLEAKIRVLEIATVARDSWLQRAELDVQLAALAKVDGVPDEAEELLDKLNRRLAKWQDRRKDLKGQARQLQQEVAEEAVNKALWRQSPRIEALAEQESWLAALENQVRALASEVAGLESQLKTEQELLGLPPSAKPSAIPRVSARDLARLRAPGRAMRDARQRRKDAREEAARNRQAAADAAARIAAALAGRAERDLTAAMERAGNLVSQLRRRVQLDERFDQMSRHQTELEELGSTLLERQMLPLWILVALGGAFVLGVVLVLAGLFLPTSVVGPTGWAFAVLGVGGACAAGVTKYLMERSAARQLEACRKQADVLLLQLGQAKEEREKLDGQLPRGGGPLTSRLQSAETDLAALEELLPVDAGRKMAEQEAAAAANRAAQARDDLRAAGRRWRESLASLGLPEGLSPKQARQFAGRCEQAADTLRRLDLRGEEMAQRRQELTAMTGRIAQLVSEAGLVSRGPGAVEQLQQLREELAEQETRIRRRDAIRKRQRGVRRKEARCVEAIAQVQRRRRGLFRDARVADEQEFRRRASEQAKVAELKRRRESLDRELAAAMGGQCSEEALREQLEGPSRNGLEKAWDEGTSRLQALEKRVRELLEQAGQTNQQLQALAENRRLAAKQLELGMVEKRLSDALTRWQMLAVTGHLLEEIRKTYEKERQPETLREASVYLNRMTEGRYTRVWTPLDEHVLLVDDSAEETLSIENLSRGTREQLFLCLRLALAASYARRGAALPLVFDDVLVNFDTRRAKSTAAVLRDFAATGFQLFVFTCHEHILKLFKALHVEARSLPRNSEVAASPADGKDAASKAPPATAKKPRKRRTKPPEPEPEVEDEVEDETPAEDPADDEPAEAAPWDEDEGDDVPEEEEEETDEEESGEGDDESDDDWDQDEEEDVEEWSNPDGEEDEDDAA
jgi:uncharacterized protein YhaN